MEPADYASARRGTQDAFFTPADVARGVWDGFLRMGLSGNAQILEPSAGVGVFAGTSPDEDFHFHLIESDRVSAGILSRLYPSARVLNASFENFDAPARIFDAVIGNPPFGNRYLYDRIWPELSVLSVHNYFIAKSMRLVRDGGLAAFVVSRWFMDAETPKARLEVAKSADFLGAVRLPSSAFSSAALTDAVTDIVFFRKNDRKTHDPSGEKWITAIRTNGVSVNSWISDHPEMIAGEMSFVRDRRYGDSAMTVSVQYDGEDLREAISARLAILPESIYSPAADPGVFSSLLDANDFESSAYFLSLKKDSFAVNPEGAVVVKFQSLFGGSRAVPANLPNAMAVERVKSMIGIRDVLRALIEAEKNDSENMEIHRQALNHLYDLHVSKYGYISSKVNSSLMFSDPEFPLLESLEVDYDPGVSQDVARKNGISPRNPSAGKAPVFRERILSPSREMSRPETALDALAISLRFRGAVSSSLIENLMEGHGDPVGELARDGRIFRNPVNGEWEIREKYLSGNVRKKLQEASEALAENPAMAANVEALKKVLPEDIGPADIAVRLGATWIPADVYVDYVKHLFPHGYPSISYFPENGAWDVSISVWDDNLNHNVYGIEEYGMDRILTQLITSHPIVVKVGTGDYDDNGREIMVVDQELTMAANQKGELLTRIFQEWIWEDDDRRDRLVRLYNDTFNTHVPPVYDGSCLEFPGMSHGISLRPHQKDAVWRSIQDGSVLFDHVVGSGKTMICIASIMEQKRMGLMQKPMVVVPNHLLGHWKKEFYRLYPDARVLVADQSSMGAKNRERMFARIATGRWDAVIVAHSSFKFIEPPQEYLKGMMQQEIDDLEKSLREAADQNISRKTIKKIEKAKEALQAKLDKLVAQAGNRSRVIDFSDLGIDALYVDESHEFKNLFFSTGMRVSGLGNPTGSAKAWDMFVKCRYLQDSHDGRGVYFMTGTPISNTIAELFSIQRYMRYDDLREKNLHLFDSWAATFAETSANWELDSTGVGYKLTTRLSRFQNVPELLSMYRSFADVVTARDLQNSELARHIPAIEGDAPRNLVAERSGYQAVYMDKIVDRMTHLPKDARIDNPLKITNDARKAGLDFRLINPLADDFENSKINEAVANIFSIWQESPDGTQLVFCDLSTPKGRKEIARKAPEEGEDAGVAANMDEFVAIDSNFSVYDDMKAKLMRMGIPAEEIAFIHDADTEVRKARLFNDVNAGRVRVLFGSTMKMGAGMNVQKKLVAAHHLDAPWRPSDLEQRNGRIIRQGNSFHEENPDFRVRIFNYATKQTYDARMWQTIEFKAASIEQFRRGDLSARVIDDFTTGAATAAEMKAAASGNPLILQEVTLAAERRRLEALESEWRRAQYRLKDSVRNLKGWKERLDAHLSKYERALAAIKENTRTFRDGDVDRIMLVLKTPDGILRGDALKEHVRETVLSEVRNPTEKGSLIGAYRGLDMICGRMRTCADSRFRIILDVPGGGGYFPDNLIFDLSDKKLSISGVFQRVDNFIASGIDRELSHARARAAREREELETAERRLDAPFEFAEEYARVIAEHDEVLLELQKSREDEEQKEAAETAEKSGIVSDACVSLLNNGDLDLFEERISSVDDEFLDSSFVWEIELRCFSSSEIESSWLSQRGNPEDMVRNMIEAFGKTHEGLDLNMPDGSFFSRARERRPGTGGDRMKLNGKLWDNAVWLKITKISCRDAFESVKEKRAQVMEA